MTVPKYVFLGNQHLYKCLFSNAYSRLRMRCSTAELPGLVGFFANFHLFSGNLGTCLGTSAMDERKPSSLASALR